ncbi:hypothetical protein M9Y10_041228 [Tritrichomonas musculus]|uniref:TATA element modulatory factor 1 TATA binding domain-containing protein n=1 Tax=Tritrichomonas musculus TaxID=1915356 RepID=A0ABR2K3Z6_9EUKA
MTTETPNSKDELQTLEHLYERRTHELKSIKLLVKQKSEETQKYFDFCGDNPTYDKLKNILTDKLNESENKISEARKRVRDIRLQKKILSDKKTEADQITKSTVSSSQEIQQLNTSITQLNSEFETKSKQIDKKREEFKMYKNELEKYKSEVTTTQRFLDNSKKNYEELLKEKAKLKQQQINLSTGTESNNILIKEIKSSINPAVIQTLQKENEHLLILLNQATANLPIEIEETIVQQDLDPIYQEQINTSKIKLSNLKQTLVDSQKKFDEARKTHKIEMNDLRLKLDNLKKKNNMIRTSIESIESSIPQTLAPLTKELEMWRNKVEKASKSAKENEQKINQQRDQAEQDVLDAEKQSLILKDELKRIREDIKRQTITNDQKNIEMENSNSNLGELYKSKQSLSNDVTEAKQKIKELTDESDHLSTQIQDLTKELNESEIKYSKELNQLKDEIKNQPKLSKASSSSSSQNKNFLNEIKNSNEIQNENEMEIRESVASLEAQYNEKKKQLDEVNAKYEKTAELQKKFEAALDLIVDLEDEEKYLTQELKMIREQFEASLNSLKNK